VPSELPQLRPRDAVLVGVVLDLVARIPQELLLLPQRETVAFNACVSPLRIQRDRWIAGDQRSIVQIDPGARGGHWAQKNPLQVLYFLLRQCPDETPGEDTHELSFIGESPELRRSIRLDLSESNRSLEEGRWKAATVLGGAVVEALLLWALDRDEYREKAREATKPRPGGRSNNNLSTWGLATLATAASHPTISIIGKQTNAQVELAKDFRNLIHPGREKRLAQGCDRGTALNALAAVERVVADLERKFLPPIIETKEMPMTTTGPEKPSASEGVNPFDGEPCAKCRAPLEVDEVHTTLPYVLEDGSRLNSTTYRCTGEPPHLWGTWVDCKTPGPPLLQLRYTLLPRDTE
jgi:hypothetical protein